MITTTCTDVYCHTYPEYYTCTIIFLTKQTLLLSPSSLPRAYIFFATFCGEKPGYRDFPSTYLDGSLGIFKDTKHKACVAGVE